MPAEISAHWLGVDGFFVLGLPFAILIALLVSRRRRDGWWRGMLRFGLATYLVILEPP